MIRKTNNDIRKFLGFEVTPIEFTIRQVDSLKSNKYTLMFMNKFDIVLLDRMDTICEKCLFIVDGNNASDRFITSKNDFIFSKNPKYDFAKVVSNFNLSSRLQLAHAVQNYPISQAIPKDSLHCYECYLGNNVHIDPYTIIGGTDFSPVLGDSREELIQFPQLGGVKIGDNVLIKYNTMIGKGTFDYTVIGDNTMIDYGCQIGHNCQIGKSCIIAAGTIIGGSTTIGDCTTIGIGAKIRNGIHIGCNVSIGMGAVVIKDIPDDTVVVGNPARVIEHKHIIDKGGLR